MIGIVLIAHAPLASALASAASHVYTCAPERAEAQLRLVDVPADVDPAAALAQARALVREADDGHGVLVLTDVFGATPSNITRSTRRWPAGRRAWCRYRPPRPRLSARAAPPALIQRDFTISNRLGLHARPSAQLTQVASRFQSEVWITKAGRRVNAKSIMGVMMLAAGQGSVVTVDCDGPDEAAALDAVGQLIGAGFGED